jgi:hypothetical protein
MFTNHLKTLKKIVEIKHTYRVNMIIHKYNAIHQQLSLSESNIERYNKSVGLVVLWKVVITVENQLHRT